MFSQLIKSIMTMVNHKPEQQTSHISEPQAPGPLTVERVLEEFNRCSDLSHRTYPAIDRLPFNTIISFAQTE